MSADTTALQHSLIQQACKQLRLPGIGAQFQRLAAQAERERQGSLGYLDALLSVEIAERERHTLPRRLKAAYLPRLKTLEEFDFSQAPQISPSRIAAPGGGRLPRAGRAGGLPRRLGHRQDPPADRPLRGRLPPETAGALRHRRRPGQRAGRGRHSCGACWRAGRATSWSPSTRSAYVPLAEVGAEFLFQVIAERAENAAVLLTTNLPFSEWTQVIPNARLCKALLDRITDRAHIIETGSESYPLPPHPGATAPKGGAADHRRMMAHWRGGPVPMIKVGQTGLSNTRSDQCVRSGFCCISPTHCRTARPNFAPPRFAVYRRSNSLRNSLGRKRRGREHPRPAHYWRYCWENRGAEDGIRTRDLLLGKEMLYH